MLIKRVVYYIMCSALFGFLGHPAFGDGERKNTGLQNARKNMVEQIRRYGVKDSTVLNAMQRVKRHLFIPEQYRNIDAAYSDHPCSIGHGQTISQPFIVAYMTMQLDIQKGEKVLEIGTGSGYQAAVLAECGAEVFTIEIIPELAEHARKVLEKQAYTNISVKTGDGYKGWKEHAPYDAVIVTCAPEKIPEPLIEQLAEDGRMMIPVGEWQQRLILLKKENGKIQKKDDIPVRFVPMVHADE
jgi:protein-L-isoaspartate(D-aspartate) O-methyltransferase